MGKYKLDILCSSGDETVIIENQLEKTDHRHLGQILTYAAGTRAKKVIWVAESFEPEHLAVLDFLNESTTDALNFFAVQIELWKIGHSPYAPKFEVLIQPDQWAKVEREQTRSAANASPSKQQCLKLWEQLRTQLSLTTQLIKTQKPRAQSWLTITIGRTGFQINPKISQKYHRLGVELYITH